MNNYRAIIQLKFSKTSLKIFIRYIKVLNNNKFVTINVLSEAVNKFIDIINNLDTKLKKQLVYS